VPDTQLDRIDIALLDGIAHRQRHRAADETLPAGVRMQAESDVDDPTGATKVDTANEPAVVLDRPDHRRSVAPSLQRVDDEALRVGSPVG